MQDEEVGSDPLTERLLRDEKEDGGLEGAERV